MKKRAHEFIHNLFLSLRDGCSSYKLQIYVYIWILRDCCRRTSSVFVCTHLFSFNINFVFDSIVVNNLCTTIKIPNKNLWQRNLLDSIPFSSPPPLSPAHSVPLSVSSYFYDAFTIERTLITKYYMIICRYVRVLVVQFEWCNCFYHMNTIGYCCHCDAMPISIRHFHFHFSFSFSLNTFFFSFQIWSIQNSVFLLLSSHLILGLRYAIMLGHQWNWYTDRTMYIHHYSSR